MSAIKNISQSVRVPVSVLLRDVGKLPSEVKDAMIAYAAKSAEGKVTDADAKALAALLPETINKSLESFGCKAPSDIIEMSMRLSDFLYHAYALNNKPPEAPLALKRYEKRLLDLAEQLDKDEFEVPDDVKTVLEQVLSDDAKWATTQFGASVKVGDSTKYVGLTSHGARMFDKIINVSVDLVISWG